MGEPTMTVVLNNEAYQQAEGLIEQGQYRINSMWRDAQPRPEAIERFQQANGAAGLGLWYLAEDTSQPEDSPTRYRYPVGDFKSVHRSGLLAAKNQAEKEGQTDVVNAVDELLFLFDRISAC
jgi:hypothetical protein